MARILVVDDEASMRQVIRHACERAGHEVFEAIDAPSAVVAYERVKPDLMILDIGMPGGGGKQVLSTLRSRPSLALSPVLVVTGSMSGSPDEIRTALRVDAAVLKPFRVAVLTRSIAELLGAAGAGATGPAPAVGDPPPSPPPPPPPSPPPIP